MKTSIVTFLAVCMLAPVSVSAFSKDTVNRSSAVFPGGQTALYTLTVPVGGFREDIYIPIMGVRDLPHGTQGGYFGYQMRSGIPAGHDSDGLSLGILLSGAEIVDGMYRIPAYSATFMTFLATLTVSGDESNVYEFAVTEFPFFVGEDMKPNKFSTGELKYLVTNYEALNFEQDSE